MTLDYVYEETNTPIKEILLRRVHNKPILFRKAVYDNGPIKGVSFWRLEETVRDGDNLFLTDTEVDEFIKALQDIRDRGVL